MLRHHHLASCLPLVYQYMLPIEQYFTALDLYLQSVQGTGLDGWHGSPWLKRPVSGAHKGNGVVEGCPRENLVLRDFSGS